MQAVQIHWNKIKEKVVESETYSLEETVDILKRNNYYKTLQGKAKNRSLLKENLKLYKSIYSHTAKLESGFKQQGGWKGMYNFYKRVLFLVEKDSKLENLKCECGKKYTWTKYCRYCPEYKRTFEGKKHSQETKLKQRISTLRYLEELKGQLVPRYNKKSIPFIEKYGQENGYKFMHAENGGEFFIKELGYFVDAYDPVANVVLEIDERHHYTVNGTLREKDVIREKEIRQILRCEFIRVKDGDI